MFKLFIALAVYQATLPFTLGSRWPILNYAAALCFGIVSAVYVVIFFMKRRKSH